MPNTIIKEIQQKQQGSTISNYPIAAMAENIILKDGSILEDALGDINVFEKGSVIDQIKSVKDMIGVQHYALETNPIVMDSLTLKNSSGNLFYANKDNVQIKAGIPLKANGGVETTSLKATGTTYINRINGGTHQNSASSNWVGAFRLYTGDPMTSNPSFIASGNGSGTNFLSSNAFNFQSSGSGTTKNVFNVSKDGNVTIYGTSISAPSATLTVGNINCNYVGKIVNLTSFSDTCQNFVKSINYATGRPYLVYLSQAFVQRLHRVDSGLGSGYGIAWKTSNEVCFITFFRGAEIYHVKITAAYSSQKKQLQGVSQLYRIGSTGTFQTQYVVTWHNVNL